MMARHKLARIWSSTRCDDQRGMISRLMRYPSAGLHATLVRNNTSDAGRRREELCLTNDPQADGQMVPWIALAGASGKTHLHGQGLAF